MSRNQKAPLLAFVLVALVCGLILVDTMRTDGRDHPLIVLNPEQLGPAYFLAPEVQPIPPVEIDESIEVSGAPSSPAPGFPGSPDGVDRGADESSGAVGGSHSADGAPGDNVDDPADEGELWPPSTVIKIPIIAFTIFGPDDETPSEEPSESPSEEPSEEPSESPSESPSEQPSEEPSESPSEEPSEEPSTNADPDDGDTEPEGAGDAEKEPVDAPTGDGSQSADPDSAP